MDTIATIVIPLIPFIVFGLILYGGIYPNKVLPNNMRRGRIFGGIIGLGVGYTVSNALLAPILVPMMYPDTAALPWIFMFISTMAFSWMVFCAILFPKNAGRNGIVLKLFGTGVITFIAGIISMA